MCAKFLALGFYGTYKDEWNLGFIYPDETMLVEVKNPDREPEDEVEMKEVPRDYQGYFNDGWNILDFLIVLSSGMLFININVSSSSIRVLRVLRPLRTLNKIPALKVLIGTLMQALSGLFDVLILLAFLFMCFAIVAVQLFKGVLHRRCFTSDVPIDATLDEFWKYEEFCAIDMFCSDPMTKACTGGNCVSRGCSEEYPYCLEIAPNPEDGVISWDNIFYALLQIFWIICLEDWVGQMYLIQDTVAGSIYTIYFYMLVILVSFFAVNLCLAVIEETYSKERDHVPVAKYQNSDLLKKVYEDVIAKNVEAAAMEHDEELKKKMMEEAQVGINVSAASKTDRMRIEVDPHEEQQNLWEERLKDFEIAYWAWNESELPVNHYLDGKDECVLFINRVVLSQAFETFIFFCILLNTALLAVNGPGVGDNIMKLCDQINTILTWIFFGEMVLQIIGKGWDFYWSDNWNRFDFFIVWISVGEFLLLLIPQFQSGGSLSALRSFRLLRIVRVAGKIESMRILLSGVIQSLADVFYLILILLLFLFMFTVLGQSLFGEHWSELETENEWTFGKNFFWSLMTVFQILTGDAWNVIMVEALSVTRIYLCFYFVLCLTFGTFVVLNLFIAILLSRFGDEDEEKWCREDSLSQAHIYRKEGLADEEDGEVKAVKLLVRHLRQRRHDRDLKKKMNAWKKSRDKTEMLGKSFGLFKAHNYLRIACSWLVHKWWFRGGIDCCILINCGFLAAESPEKTGQQVFKIAEYAFTAIFVMEMVVKMIAFGVFPQPFFTDIEWKPLKLNAHELEKEEKKCCDVVNQMSERDKRRVVYPLQDNIIHKILQSDDGFRVVMFTKTEDMRLVFDDETFRTAYIMDKNKDGQHGWIEWDMGTKTKRPDITTVCKSFSLSNTNYNSYMSSNWDRLDCFVVLVGLIGTLSKADNVGPFRALRAIRPLRIAVRIDQVKVVVSAVMRAMPGMINTTVFCLVFWFILAIIGCVEFSDELYECICKDEDDEVCNAALEEVITSSDCQSDLGMEWQNRLWNFDDIFQSTHTLFTVATLSGWNETMYAVIDSRGADLQPKHFAYDKPIVGIYFMMVILVCSFFSLNLIISVVVDTFNRIKAEKDGSAFLTAKQLDWVKSKRLSNQIKLERDPVVPAPDTFKFYCYQISRDIRFEYVIMSCILLNTCFMAAEHYNSTPAVDKMLDVVDKIFLGIFSMEAAIKIFAFGMGDYFHDDWNKFDFGIVISGYISLIPVVADTGVGLTVVRLFRIGRVLRLINKTKTLRSLFWTLIYSVPSLWNIGALISVIFFIYAIIGMNLFGESGCGYMKDGETLDDEEWQCGLTDNGSKVNFSTFSLSMSLLFRVGTQDGWTDVYSSYQELMGTQIAIVTIYFSSFFLIGVLIMVNLFIAVILDIFDDNQKLQQQEDIVISVHDWRDKWKEHDIRAKGIITAEQFLDTILRADKPTGFKNKIPTEDLNTRKTQRKIASRLLDLKLLASQHFEDENNSYFSGFCGFFKFCGTIFFSDTEFVERDARRDISVEEEDNSIPWCVEYQSSVSAIVMRVLKDSDDIDFDLPVTITPHEGEKFIAAWYCENYLGKPDLLAEIKEERRRKELDARAIAEGANIILQEQRSRRSTLRGSIAGLQSLSPDNYQSHTSSHFPASANLDESMFSDWEDDDKDDMEGGEEIVDPEEDRRKNNRTRSIGTINTFRIEVDPANDAYNDVSKKPF